MIFPMEMLPCNTDSVGCPGKKGCSRQFYAAAGHAAICMCSGHVGAINTSAVDTPCRWPLQLRPVVVLKALDIVKPHHTLSYIRAPVECLGYALGSALALCVWMAEAACECVWTLLMPTHMCLRSALSLRLPQHVQQCLPCRGQVWFWV